MSRTYMMDGLGNVVGSWLDGSSGAAIICDSWGNVETDSTAYMRLNTLRFGFKGMLLYDEVTGLHSARARWYQPDVGRFMSEDPIGLSGWMNQYVFAGDDPINASDPSGAVGASGHAATGPGSVGDIRGLSQAEKSTFGGWCAVAICDNVTIVDGPFSRSITFGYIIILGTDDWNSPDVLAHELTHTTQYESWGAFDC